MHIAGDGHDTPYRLPASDQLGGGWSVQLLPSQRSINGSSPPVPEYDPTAVQAAAELQDTAVNAACAGE
jgi:hypothetical protein